MAAARSSSRRWMTSAWTMKRSPRRRRPTGRSARIAAARRGRTCICSATGPGLWTTRRCRRSTRSGRRGASASWRRSARGRRRASWCSRLGAGCACRPFASVARSCAPPVPLGPVRPRAGRRRFSPSTARACRRREAPCREIMILAKRKLSGFRIPGIALQKTQKCRKLFFAPARWVCALSHGMLSARTRAGLSRVYNNRAQVVASTSCM